MPRPKKVPSYRLHSRSGQAVVTLTDAAGNRRDVYLGDHGSAESRAEYARVLTEWESQNRSVPVASGDMTINEIMLAYIKYVEKRYPSKDKRTNTLMNVKDALRPLKALYGHVVAREFGPKSLKAVQYHMAQPSKGEPGKRDKKGLARKTINRRIGRIKTMFRWAESEELIPAGTRHALETVRGLEYGEAREKAPIKPVPLAHVESTLVKADPMIRDMVNLQLATGMRPGELVIMRGIDIDMTGPVWIYTPESHKTQHRGHTRAIAIGPKGQDIIRRHLQANVEAFLFSPAEKEAERFRRLRAARKTKVQPSQQNRRKKNRRRAPKDRYDVASYYRAIRRAAKRADVPLWHPHQLRHTAATLIRKQYGIDAARAVLGHRSPAITEVYAELDQSQAAEVMEKIG